MKQQIGTQLLTWTRLMMVVLATASGASISAQQVSGGPGGAEVTVDQGEARAALAKFRITEVIYVDDQGKTVDVSEMSLLTRVGESLNTETVGKDLQTLQDSKPQFKKIAVRLEPIPEQDKVRVLFEFQMTRTIKTVRILGKTGEPLDLRKPLKLLSQQGRNLVSEEIQQDLEKIQTVLVQQGFPKAQVSYSIQVSDSAGNVDLIFQVDLQSTRPSFLSRYELEPNTEEIQKVWASVVKNPDRTLHLKSQAKVFNLTQWDEDMGKLHELFEDAGYVRAELSRKYTTLPSGEVIVQIAVQPGPRFEVRATAIEGNTILTEAELLKGVDSLNGRAFSPKRVKRAMGQLREKYGQLGYIVASVGVDFNGDEKKMIYTIREGVIQHVESFRVEGSLSFSEEQVLRDVMLKKGEVVTSDRIRKTIERLQKTGYYSEVNVSYEASQEDRGVIVVQVKEHRAQSISLLGGVSGVGAHGNAGYTNNNLWGSGKSVSADMFMAGEMSVLSLIFRDPHLAGSQFGLTFRTGMESSHLAFFNRREKLARIEIDRRITERLKLGFGARFESVSSSNFSDELKSELGDSPTQGRISGFVGRMSYRNERLDDSGTPVSGYRWKALLEPSYGMGRYYTRATGELQKHVSAGRSFTDQSSVLTFRMTLGYATSGTPFFEKFYAGGDDTLRGMNLWSITPEGSRAGGRSMLGGGTYYVVPVVKNGLKAVTFVEAVSVSQNFRPRAGDVRVVGGAGGRINLGRFLPFLPAGLNNFELGASVALRKLPQDRMKKMYVVIGGYDPTFE